MRGKFHAFPAFLCAAIVLCCGCEDTGSNAGTGGEGELRTPPATSSNSETAESAAGDTRRPTRQPTPIRSELAEHFQLIGQDRTGPARIRLRKHLDRQPNDAQALFLFGLSYHREKKYSEAEKYYLQAIDADPEFETTWYFLGWATYYLGKPEDSRAAFTRHLNLIGDSYDTHYGLGLLDLEDNDLTSAREHFRTALALVEGEPIRPPEIAKIHVRLSDVDMLEDDPESAVERLLTARELFPMHEQIHHKLHAAYMRLGEEEAAAEVLEQAEQLKQQAGQSRSR